MLKCRPLLIALFILCTPLVARANTDARGWCEIGGQRVLTSGLNSTTQVQQSNPQCTVTVYVHGGGTLATIFQDNNPSPTPLTNPFFAGTQPGQSSGQWIFYAADGRYDVTMTGAGLPGPVTYFDILLCDPFGTGICQAGGPGSGCPLLGPCPVNVDVSGVLIGKENTVDFIPGTGITITPATDSGGKVHLTFNTTVTTGCPTAGPCPINVDVNGSLVGKENTLDLVPGTNVTLTPATDSGGAVHVTINSTASATGCALPGINIAVLSEHPAGTCYDSLHWTWDDGASKQNWQAGLSNTFGTNVSLLFAFGTTNATCTTVGVTCADYLNFGASNNLEGTSGHSTDTNTNHQYVIGFSNTTANAERSWILGDLNTLTGDGNVALHNLTQVYIAGQNNTITATDAASQNTNIVGAWVYGQNDKINATTGGSISNVMCLILACNSTNGIQATSLGNVNTSVIGGTNTTLSSTGTGSNTSSIFGFGEVNSFTSAAGCNLSDTFFLGESDTAICGNNASTNVNSNIMLGFNTTLTSNGASALALTKVFTLGDTLAASSTTAASSEIFLIGQGLTASNCSFCYLIGHNGTTSTSNFMGIGLSANPELQITANNARRFPTVFASVVTCAAGTEGSFSAITDSTVNTWGTTITGSGTNHVLGYCDGTSWTVAAK